MNSTGNAGIEAPTLGAEVLATLNGALAPHGMWARGALCVRANGPGAAVLAQRGIQPPATVILVGHAGPAMWAAFQRAMDAPGSDNAATGGTTQPTASAEPEQGSAHPLDDWTRTVLTPVAVAMDASAIFPSDRPYAPFQTWARAVEPVWPSPLGPLIHSTYGLWHAYRAAFVFPGECGLATPADRGANAALAPAGADAGAPAPDDASPCATCTDQPCRTACPVNAAARPGGLNVPACVSHLSTPDGDACFASGCLARAACPVGRAYAWPETQNRFHMAAFLRGRLGGS